MISRNHLEQDRAQQHGTEGAGATRRRRRSETSLCELIARADHLIGQAFSAHSKSLGLPPTVRKILAVLSAHESRDMTELAALVLLKQSTLTKAIDRLEQAGLAERRAAETDRRCALVRLTSEGKRRAAMLPRLEREQDAQLRALLGQRAARQAAAALACLIEKASAVKPGRGAFWD